MTATWRALTTENRAQVTVPTLEEPHLIVAFILRVPTERARYIDDRTEGKKSSLFPIHTLGVQPQVALFDVRPFTNGDRMLNWKILRCEPHESIRPDPVPEVQGPERCTAHYKFALPSTVSHACSALTPIYLVAAPPGSYRSIER